MVGQYQYPPWVLPWGYAPIVDPRAGGVKKKKASAQKSSAKKAPKKKASSKKKTSNGKGVSEAGLGGALEEARQALDDTLSVWQEGAATWFDEKEGDAIMDFISKHEQAWVASFLGLAYELEAAAADARGGSESAIQEMKRIHTRAAKAEEAIDRLTNYTVDLQDGQKLPSYSAAMKELSAFFASLLPIPSPHSAKKSKSRSRSTSKPKAKAKAKRRK